MEPVITNSSPDGLRILNAVFIDVVLSASAAETWPKGLILALNTTSQFYVPYVLGGADGTGVPSLVLNNEIVFEAAGQKTCKAIGQGILKEPDLIKQGVPGPLLASEALQLRGHGIVAQKVKQLAQFDNQ